MPRGKNGTRFAAQKQRILDNATRVFSEKGYAATSLEDLAGELGVTKAALYYYFDNKESILLEICDATMDQILSEMANIVGDPSIDAGEKIRILLLQLLETMHRDLGAFTVFLQEAAWRDHPDAMEIRNKQRYYTDSIEKLISSGISEGTLQPVPPRITALALLGMCNWSYRWMRSEGIPPDEIAAGFFALVSSGMIPPPE